MSTEVVSRKIATEASLPEVHATVQVSRSPVYWRRLLGFIGPGFLISVGYMDPGNWATDIAGGARFGYTLLFVIMVSNLLAILLQSLSLKLGIATERDLAQLCHEAFGKKLSFVFWLMAEIAIAACDLAEVIGSAIALQLLFHIPLFYGVLITGIDVMLILLLQKWGFRYVEALVIALIGTIIALFGMQMVLSHPDYGPAFRDLVVPSSSILTNGAMLYIAIGILGATVMPHNLYLHSSVVQTRVSGDDAASKRSAIRFSRLDTIGSLSLALLVNAAILILAAAAFHGSGHTEVVEIQDAYHLLDPLVGGALASFLFGFALLAAGQSSTFTGTIAGQVVMEGFLRAKIPCWQRRLITRGLALVPALIGVLWLGEAAVGKLLVLSQVVLSLQLPFALWPLIRFSSDRGLMGEFVNPRWVSALAWSLFGLISAANLTLLYFWFG